VLFGTEKFRPYLEHSKFVLKTDNQALSWLLSHPRQLGKIGRWVVKISSLKFEVQHIRGTQNVVANALSRMFESPQLAAPQLSSNALLTHFPLALQDLRTYQREDPELLQIIGSLENREPVGNYSINKGVLHCRSRGMVRIRLWCRLL
jgi:hypothetical protein